MPVDPYKVYEAIARIISEREGVEVTLIKVEQKNTSLEAHFDKPTQDEV